MLDFRQITLFCFGYRLLVQRMTIFSKNLGAWPPSPPWLLVTPMLRFKLIYLAKFFEKTTQNVKI